MVPWIAQVWVSIAMMSPATRGVLVDELLEEQHLAVWLLTLVVHVAPLLGAAMPTILLANLSAFARGVGNPSGRSGPL